MISMVIDLYGQFNQLNTQSYTFLHFCNHTIIKIWSLICNHYAFCKWLNTLDYIAKLLKKENFFGNNIENMSNQSYYYRSFTYRLTNYFWVLKQFLIPIIVNAFIIIFYKVIQNFKLFFNTVILTLFNIFCSKMLAF